MITALLADVIPPGQLPQSGAGLRCDRRQDARTWTPGGPTRQELLDDRRARWRRQSRWDAAPARLGDRRRGLRRLPRLRPELKARGIGLCWRSPATTRSGQVAPPSVPTPCSGVSQRGPGNASRPAAAPRATATTTGRSSASTTTSGGCWSAADAPVPLRCPGDARPRPHLPNTDDEPPGSHEGPTC